MAGGSQCQPRSRNHHGLQWPALQRTPAAFAGHLRHSLGHYPVAFIIMYPAVFGLVDHNTIPHIGIQQTASSFTTKEPTVFHFFSPRVFESLLLLFLSLEMTWLHPPGVTNRTPVQPVGHKQMTCVHTARIS